MKSSREAHKTMIRPSPRCYKVISHLSFCAVSLCLVRSPEGRGMYIRFSSRRRKASSMSQGKFVAARTITNLEGSSPSRAPPTPARKKQQNKICSLFTQHIQFQSISKSHLAVMRRQRDKCIMTPVPFASNSNFCNSLD